jgi:uncharacterized protein (TIGR02099 family)
VNSTTKRLLRAVEVLAWGVFFAFAALVLALRFWVLPDIERYREPIVAAMSRGIGLQVKVNAIEAGWLGLRPQITLTGVRIYDAQGREALVLPSIENVVAWHSLLHGELRLHRLVIGDGLRLGVRRDPAGDLYVAGLKMGRGEGGAGLGGLLAQGEIVIRNAEIEWRDERRGAPPLVFSGLDLKLARSGDSISLGLKARTPPELGSAFELRALVEANALQPAALSGRVFLEVGQTDLAAWRAWVDYPLELRQGRGALRVWATLEKGSLKEATADIALADVRASLGDHLNPLELASVRGRVSGRTLADGTEFSGRGLALVMERGPEIPKTDFQVVWRPQAGGALAASHLDLEATTQLVAALPLPPQIGSMLEEFAPRGRLSDSRLEWSGPFDAPARLAARMRFADLAMRARDAIPGFSGLSGSLEATQDKGKLSLSSAKAALELPRVFPEARIALDSLAGELDWERDRARGVTVRVASLSFANEHASGNLFGTYVHTGEGPGILDLSAILSRADARHVARYLPHPGIMGEKARHWIANAVIAGEASDVRVRVRGDLRQFPFTDPASGQFQVSARVEKGVLDYAEGWPRIHDVAGELNFERERMDVIGRSGSVLGAQLSGVRVSMPSFRADDRHVLVSGQAEGPSAEFLKYVRASPLREIAGSFVEDIQAAGRGRLRLKLDLALADLTKPKVAADYEFSANEVTVVSWLPPIEASAGRLGFTESSFTLHDVRGRLLGGAVAISGGIRPGRGLEVVARGDASFAATRALFDHPVRKHVMGTFGYAVTVRGQDGQAHVIFESPLRGIESALPPPLAKSAAESLPLRIEVHPAGSERDRISIALGALARADVARRRQGDTMVTQRTAVWLTPERNQPIRLPERPGTLVYGSLAAFDFDRWLPLLGGGDGGAEAVALELKIGSLDAFGRRLSNVALRASGESAGWSANVSADELAGDVSYRGGSEPRVIARLSHFTVPADTPGLKPGPAPRPSELPAIDLVADEFTFRGKPLGRVELVASRAGGDWNIEKATMANPDASLTGRGMWYAAPSRTAVQFELSAADAGGFLGRAGYPGLVKGGKARMQASLAWRGDPATLDFPTLGGELQMQAEDGQFLEIEPGIGKLISLMSLQALPRRLTLDFRDVFSKGFQFDRIASAGQVEDGVLRLKEFRMRGSAADVEMSGEVDLARETENLRVRVIPSLSDSAALGIGIVNPVAGVVAVIAQRILKNPLGQIFAHDYSVSGTWSDPKVAKMQPPPLQEMSPQ